MVSLTHVHHIAIPANDIAAGVKYYTDNFECVVSYQDESWALLEFANVNIALVKPEQHDPHIGFECMEPSSHEGWKKHRDDVEYIYKKDPSGNTVELLNYWSLN